MKRTVLIAGCAIALAGTATTAVADRGEPIVMPYGDFQTVGQLADWVLPADLLARRGRGGHGADDGPGHAFNRTMPDLLHLAKNGADDGPNHDSGDDHGGRGSDDDDDDNGSGSGRHKPRVPGGSGCDDAGDVAEHPACSG